jgi:dolichyl-phosphate beta-glucosyltransferase
MNSSTQLSFLLVVPCFNEENRLDLNAWKNTIKSFTNISWLFVDDGSLDNTFILISDLALLDNVNVLRLPINQGKAEAIRSGLSKGLSEFKTDVVGFIDSDRAFYDFDIAQMTNFLQDNPDYNAVFSSRVALLGRQINRSLPRHFFGRLLVTFIAFGFKAAPYDCQSGFKLFRVESTLKMALQTPFSTHWFFDLELLIRLFDVKKFGYCIWELPLRGWDEVPGSKIDFWQVLRILKEAVIVKRQVKSHLKRRALWT